MSSNPYQPPESHDTRVSRILPRDLGSITLWTTVVFSLEAVTISAISVSEFLLGRRTAGRALSSGEMPTAPEVVFGLSTLAFFLLWILGAVLFFVWIRRANINADEMVSGGTEFTPGWAVGWFFVPFANFYMPYRVVAEIYRASDPKADPDYWRLSEVPRYLMLWWLSHVAFNLISSRNSPFVRGPEQLQLGGWPAVVQGVSGATTALMVVVVVRSIRRLQEEKSRRSSRVAASIDEDRTPGV